MSRVLACALMATTFSGFASGVRAGDLAFGEYLSGECVTCHRIDGQDKGIPPIIGWPADQFEAVLQSYKAKDRANPVMQTIAGRLSAEDMAALAAYFESLKPK